MKRLSLAAAALACLFSLEVAAQQDINLPELAICVNVSENIYTVMSHSMIGADTRIIYSPDLSMGVSAKVCHITKRTVLEPSFLLEYHHANLTSVTSEHGIEGKKKMNSNAMYIKVPVHLVRVGRTLPSSKVRENHFELAFGPYVMYSPISWQKSKFKATDFGEKFTSTCSAFDETKGLMQSDWKFMYGLQSEIRLCSGRCQYSICFDFDFKTYNTSRFRIAWKL